MVNLLFCGILDARMRFIFLGSGVDIEMCQYQAEIKSVKGKFFRVMCINFISNH